MQGSGNKVVRHLISVFFIFVPWISKAQVQQQDFVAAIKGSVTTCVSGSSKKSTALNLACQGLYVRYVLDYSCDPLPGHVCF